MTIQWAGLILAGVTFGTIGFVHVLVRRLHARFGTRPAAPLFILGALILFLSLLFQDNLLSGAFGIISITVLWDGVEIYRQEKRMRREVNQ